MRKDFEDCAKNGGKIKVKHLKNNKYIRICYDKDGNSFSSNVMVEKLPEDEKSNKEVKQRKQIEDSRLLVDSLLELQKHINEHYHT
jgi:hypothetical protein